MTPETLNRFAGSWHGAVFAGLVGCLVYNAIRGNRFMSLWYVLALGVETYAVHDHICEEIDRHA
jgi:hypothetical protein